MVSYYVIFCNIVLGYIRSYYLTRYYNSIVL